MFRRLESGIPKDPVFPVGLDELGYFINDIDEVRSKQNPRAWFHYFLTKNSRYNDVQREAMNGSLREIVLDRLHGLGLETIRLPLTAGPLDPHVPILVSPDLKKATRVVVVFGEPNQDLGIWAHRIIGGEGGINLGSAVNLVEYLQSQAAGPNDPNSPGVIIANCGQTYWWRKGKKAVTLATWNALPRKSAVAESPRLDPVKNTVEENRNAREHIEFVLTKIVPEFVNPKAALDIIGISDSSNQIVDFFNEEKNWWKLEERLGGMALLAPFYNPEVITNDAFADYLKHRGRAFIASELDANLPICGPEGNRKEVGMVAPTFSIGGNIVYECYLPHAYTSILDWFLEIEKTGEEYTNPQIVQVGDDDDEEEIPQTWGPELGKDEASWMSRPFGDDGKEDKVETQCNSVQAEEVRGLEEKMKGMTVEC